MYNRCFQFANTKESCYWLGFLYCDSSIQSNRIGLSLSIKSEGVLDSLLSFMGLPSSVKRPVTVKLKYRNEIREYPSINVLLYNKELLRDLAQYGLYGLKRERVVYPRFENDDLQLAFLSGCYEADGMKYTSAIGMGNKNILLQIKHIHLVPFVIREIKNLKGTMFALSLGMTLKKKMIDNLMPPIIDKWVLGSRPSSKKSRNKPLSERTLRINWVDKNLATVAQEALDNPLKVLAEKYGVSAKVLSYHLKKAGNKVRNSKEVSFTKRKFNPNREELHKLIMEDRVSMVQLGKKYGVSDNAVKKRAIKLGIL